MEKIMKNLAGNSVSIFLFRFVLRKNAISFVLNETIAEDMYPDIDEQIEPLVHACSETLLRYRSHCRGETIMDGNILIDGGFEVMLFKGLGKYFAEREKQNLFNDAHKIAELLTEVMERRTKEEQQGTYPGPQPLVRKFRRTQSTNKGLETLGNGRQVVDELQGDTRQRIPVLNELWPDDLPADVVATRGYDHRGHCMAFEHETLGDLGKIVLTDIAGDKLLMHADLTKGNAQTLDKRKKVFEDIISLVEVRLRDRLAERERT